LFRRLVDDAAIFPPGNAAMPAAVTAHRRHRAGWYAELVGPFLCSDQRLPELQRALPAEGEPLPLGIVVAGGAGAIEPALVWISREQRATLAAVEVALRSTDDLAAGARRIVAALDAGLPANDIPAYVEMPRPDQPPMLSASWLDALDVIAAAGHRVKYRTGGSHALDFPGEWELAHLLESAFDRELALKCTAGLHGAVRRTAPATGFEEHGFLNVALATRAALDGADTADLAATLGRRDRDAVAADVRALTPEQAASTRRWFVSFGSCSVSEPLDELVELGLFAKETVGG
jgi:hypothetical protein